MMKKMLSLFMVMVMLVTLTACGNNSKPNDSDSGQSNVSIENNEDKSGTTKTEPITLKLWAGIQPEYGYDDMVSNFNAEFADKGIQLEYTRYVNDDDGNLQLDTYLLAGDDIDIFIGYGGYNRLIKRAEANLLLDMTNYLAARGFDPISELGATNVGGYVIDDKYYALPTKYENSNWLVANTDLFEAAGVELPVKGWTYAEFLDAVEKLTSGEGPEKVYGMFWWLNGGWSSATGNLGKMLGQNVLYKDDTLKETNFDHPVYAQGLQLIADVMNKGWSPTYADEKANSLSFDNVFLQGKAAMSYGISQLRLINDLETYPRDFETALIPFPVPDESYLEQWDYSGVAGAGDLISVNAKSKHIEEAMDFVIWYIENGMASLAKGGRIPLWNKFPSDAVIDALAQKEGVFDEESLKAYLSIDTTNAYETLSTDHDSEIADLSHQAYESIFLGQATVEDALKDLKEKADALLQ